MKRFAPPPNTGEPHEACKRNQKQVSSRALGSATSLPGWTVTLVIALVVLRFPLAAFLAWVFEVTPEGLKALGTRQLQPGMPGEVLVRTGERNLLTYLWAPLARRVASALTEH